MSANKLIQHAPHTPEMPYDQSAMLLKLETLPSENICRILSNLSLSDRKNVRECSKKFRNAVQQSDFTVRFVCIVFGKNSSEDVHVAISPFSNGKMLKTSARSLHSKSIQVWLVTLRQTLFFRRSFVQELMIESHAHLVNESILQSVMQLFDFHSLHIQFNVRMQKSVINYVRPLKTGIFCLMFDYSPDPQEIIDLPKMAALSVESPRDQGFSDQQLLDIARQGHIEVMIPAIPSHSRTLCRTIEIVQSTECKEIQITLPADYYHRFLVSIGLREEGDKFMDISDSKSPILWFELDPRHPRYYLVIGSHYLYVYGGSNRRIVCIIRGDLSPDLYPSHALNMSRISEAF